MIESASDAPFITGVLTFEAWLGGTDSFVEGNWRWIRDGRPFWQGNGATGIAPVGVYTSWALSEPNGGITSDCLRVRPDASWADRACSQLFGSLCERFSS